MLTIQGWDSKLREIQSFHVLVFRKTNENKNTSEGREFGRKTSKTQQITKQNSSLQENYRLHFVFDKPNAS